MHDFVQWLDAYKPRIGKLFRTSESLNLNPWRSITEQCEISVIPYRIVGESFVREAGALQRHGVNLSIIEKEGYGRLLASNTVLFLGFGLDTDHEAYIPKPQLVPMFLLKETLVGWRSDVWDGIPGDFDLTYEVRPGCFATGNVLGPSRNLFDREFYEVTESLLQELGDE